MEKRVPRWVHPFLRALERTGKVCEAAEDAGVDRTTTFVRRRNHADFAAAWEQALQAHGERVRAEGEAEIAALRKAPPRPVPLGFPSPEGEGISGGQVKRVSGERWGKVLTRTLVPYVRSDRLAASCATRVPSGDATPGVPHLRTFS